MIGDEHFFMFLLAICMSSFEQCLSRSVHILVVWIPHVLCMKIPCQSHSLQMFPPSVYVISSLYFLLYISSSAWWNPICLFLLLFLVLLALIQKILAHSNVSKGSSYVFSGSFKVSGLKFRPLTHSDMVRDSGLIWVSVCGHLIFQHYLWKNYPCYKHLC